MTKLVKKTVVFLTLELILYIYSISLVKVGLHCIFYLVLNCNKLLHVFIYLVGSQNKLKLYKWFTNQLSFKNTDWDHTDALKIKLIKLYKQSILTRLGTVLEYYQQNSFSQWSGISIIN